MKTQHQTSSAERALLVGVTWKRARRIPGTPAGEQGRESLAEVVELARSAGAEVTGTMYQVRDAADPATLVGRGKLDEILAEATAHKAPLIIFDGNLSPMQQRNIEEATERRVIDRTQLILDIFAKHARSRDRVSKIQAGIEAVRRQRSLRREARNAIPLGTVALVGYTNAGKSTLFN